MFKCEIFKFVQMPNATEDIYRDCLDTTVAEHHEHHVTYRNCVQSLGE